MVLIVVLVHVLYHLLHRLRHRGAVPVALNAQLFHHLLCGLQLRHDGLLLMSAAAAAAAKREEKHKPMYKTKHNHKQIQGYLGLLP